MQRCPRHVFTACAVAGRAAELPRKSPTAPWHCNASGRRCQGAEKAVQQLKFARFTNAFPPSSAMSPLAGVFERGPRKFAPASPPRRLHQP